MNKNPNYLQRKRKNQEEETKENKKRYSLRNRRNNQKKDKNKEQKGKTHLQKIKIRNFNNDIIDSKSIFQNYLETKNFELLNKSIELLYELSIEDQKNLFETYVEKYKNTQDKSDLYKKIIKCLIILDPEYSEKILKINKIDDFPNLNMKKKVIQYFEYIKTLDFGFSKTEENSNLIQDYIKKLIPIENFENLYSFPPFLEKLELNNYFFFLMLLSFLKNSYNIIDNLKSNLIIYEEIQKILNNNNDINKINFLWKLSFGNIEEGNTQMIISLLNDKQDYSKQLEDFFLNQNFFSIKKIDENNSIYKISWRDNLDDFYLINIKEINYNIIDTFITSNISRLISNIERGRKYDYLNNHIYKDYIDDIYDLIIFIQKSKIMQLFYQKFFKLEIDIDESFYKKFLKNKVKYYPIMDESVTGFFDIITFEIIINSIPRGTKYHRLPLKLYKFILIGFFIFTLNHESNLHAIRRLLNSTNSEIPKNTPIEKFYLFEGKPESGKTFEKWAFNFNINDINKISIQLTLFILINDNWNLNNNLEFRNRLKNNYTIEEIRKIYSNKNIFLTKIMNKLNLKPEDFFNEKLNLIGGTVRYSNNYNEETTFTCIH